MADDDLMNIQELGEYIQKSKSWIYDHLASIPHFKLGRTLLFRRSEVDKWLEAYRKGMPLALL